MRKRNLQRHLEIGLVLAALTLPAASAESGQGQRCDDDLCIEVERLDDGAKFFAVSRRDGPATIEFDFPVFVNMNSSTELPLRTVVPARSRQSLLTIHSTNPARSGRWRWRWSWTTGVLHADHDSSARYLIPWSSSQRYKVGKGIGGSGSHTGKASYAFDFRLPSGTTVRAARAGAVVRVVEHFVEGGPEERFKKRANTVFILHSDGTIARYLHLQPQGALVELGDSVRAGDPIGLSGNTGHSHRPHLHFDVFAVDDELERQTIAVRFANGTARGFVPTTGQMLYGGEGEMLVQR